MLFIFGCVINFVNNMNARNFLGNDLQAMNEDNGIQPGNIDFEDDNPVEAKVQDALLNRVKQVVSLLQVNKISGSDLLQATLGLKEVKTAETNDGALSAVYMLTSTPDTTMNEIRQELSKMLGVNPEALIARVKYEDGKPFEEWVHHFGRFTIFETLSFGVKELKESQVGMFLKQQMQGNHKRSNENVYISGLNPNREAEVIVDIAGFAKYMNKAFPPESE